MFVIHFEFNPKTRTGNGGPNIEDTNALLQFDGDGVVMQKRKTTNKMVDDEDGGISSATRKLKKTCMM